MPTGRNQRPPGSPAQREQFQLLRLESPQVEETLRPALKALGGGSLTTWTLAAIHHRPGAGVTGIYSVKGDRVLSGTGSPPRYLCVTTARLPPDARGVLTFRDRHLGVLSVWAHPHDPLLPGLAWACDPEAATRALFPAALGAGTARLRTAGYRPLRRAVLIAELAGERRYLKVFRRGHGEAARVRHHLLRGEGVPVPRVIEVPAPDVLAMYPAEGRPLAELLMSDGAQELDPHSLVRLLASFPRAALKLPERRPWSARIRAYGDGAAAVLPDHAERIRSLAASIDSLVKATPAGPLVPSHGDFYEANLLVSGGGVSGLLDVDAVGPGHLVDDLGCFLGHLLVLPSLDPGYIHVPAAAERFTAAFEEHVDPAALRARAAGVALTLVAGAKRRAAGAASAVPWRADALQRLAAAETLAGSAQRLLRSV